MGHETRRWFKPMARAGYASRGVIYAVIGFFAALAAIGAGQPMDSRQALRELLSSGTGSVLAYTLVAALVCYALWRLIQAGFDTDSHGWNAKGLAIRGGLLASGFVYLTLAAYAWSMHRAAGSPSEGGGFSDTLAGFVGSRWAAAMIAVVLGVVGIAHAVKAVRGTYAKHLEASPRAMRIIHPISRTGLIARGGVFVTVAFLFALRAWRADTSGEAPGTRQALDYVQSLPMGGVLLAATGIGLVGFALYSFIEAMFRRINVEDA